MLQKRARDTQVESVRQAGECDEPKEISEHASQSRQVVAERETAWRLRFVADCRLGLSENIRTAVIQSSKKQFSVQVGWQR